MIMYHLNVVPFLRHATIIYSTYYFRPNEVNAFLCMLSPELNDELYDGIPATKHTFKYHMGKLILGRTGKFLFSNYARYMHCDYIKNRDKEAYTTEYNKLPTFYRKLLDSDE